MTRYQLSLKRWFIGFFISVVVLLVFGLWSLLVTKTKNVKSSGEAISVPANKLDLPLFTSDSTKMDFDKQRSIHLAARQLSDLSGMVAERALPSLVKIQVTRGANIPSDREMESYFGQLPTAKGTDIGSGFFVQPGGWILTNYHVIRGADSIRIEGANGKNWLAKVHAYDVLSDISVLKIEEKENPCIEWGDSNRLRVGNFVWIAGAPFGLEASLSFGVVSSLERSSMNGSPLRDYIQTDAAINPGNSGGPMLDIDGKVIGIVSSILGDDYRGIGFALPGDMAQSVVQQLIQNRMVKRGWIGVKLGQVTPERAKKANLDSTSGAYIEWVDQGDEIRIPAKRAGLMIGDICIGCDTIKIASPFDLARKIGMTLPGKVLSLEILRNYKNVAIEVIVAEKL